MRYALLPAGATVLLVLAGIVAVLAGPGVLASPDAPPEGDVGLREVGVQPTAVTGESVTLGVQTYLTRRDGAVSNVSVRLRATSLQTGFVEDTSRVAVGSPPPGESVVNGSVTVPREGGYRLEALLYRDGRRLTTTGAEIRGVGSLTPAYARTPVRFHRFASQPPVEFRIANTGANRTILNVSTYLTNTGDDPPGELRLVLKARQSDSNIVADTASVPVPEIEAGRTATPTAELDVPDDYNYYLDAVLWRDGVIVGTARSTANLAPTETIDEDLTREEVGIEVGEFTRTDGTNRPEPETTSSSGAVPGFTPVAALAALAAGLYWRRFR